MTAPCGGIRKGRRTPDQFDKRMRGSEVSRQVEECRQQVGWSACWIRSDPDVAATKQRGDHFEVQRGRSDHSISRKASRHTPSPRSRPPPPKFTGNGPRSRRSRQTPPGTGYEIARARAVQGGHDDSPSWFRIREPVFPAPTPPRPKVLRTMSGFCTTTRDGAAVRGRQGQLRDHGAGCGKARRSIVAEPVTAGRFPPAPGDGAGRSALAPSARVPAGKLRRGDPAVREALASETLRPANESAPVFPTAAIPRRDRRAATRGRRPQGGHEQFDMPGEVFVRSGIFSGDAECVARQGERAWRRPIPASTSSS